MAQISIKDEALIGRLRRIAARRQSSVIDVIREGVDAVEARDEARIAARLAAIREVTRGSARLFPPGTTSDHSDMYDEHGLPK